MHHDHRGVSLGTIVMLGLTILVLIAFGVILPKLMGRANLRIEDQAMRSSVNMNDSLPVVAMADIPIANATVVPPMETEAAVFATAEPENTKAAAQSDAATASPAPVTGGTVNLTFAGSIVMDDLTRKSGYYADSGKYDYSENLSLIADELKSDLTFATLEAVIDPDGNVRQLPNAPDTAMDMLSSAGIDLLALGYSRAGELGLSGIRSTIAEAQKRELATIGIYASEEDAQRLRIYTVNNVRIAYLHYADAASSTSQKKLKSDSAQYALPTVNVSSGAAAIAADITRARANGADIVIVSLNWSGTASFSTTTTKMKSFVQALADAGADVIVGAGTKAVREVTWLVGKRADGTTRQTLCAWSLGSLLNGGRNDGNVTGMILHLQLSYNGSSVSFERVTYTPTYIWRYKQDDQYRYRVIASDLPMPDGMDNAQAGYAEKSLANLQKTLGDSPVTIRTR